MNAEKIIEPSKGLLKKEEMAAILRITPRTLEHWMAEGRIPFLRISRTVRFDLKVVMDHLHAENCSGI